MTTVRACDIPTCTLLQPYSHRGFADAYTTVLPGVVSHAEFVEAFYTSTLFGLERGLLKWFARRPSTHADARRLASGEASAFAAWQVESRATNQLLLADFTGRTRSWLMVSAVTGSSGELCTQLFFGSAVLARQKAPAAAPSLGLGFHALLGFHRLYSRGLMQAACAKLQKPG